MTMNDTCFICFEREWLYVPVMNCDRGYAVRVNGPAAAVHVFDVWQASGPKKTQFHAASATCRAPCLRQINGLPICGRDEMV